MDRDQRTILLVEDALDLGTTDPSSCLEITQAVTLAFFDQHLGGKTKASLESLAQKYPALKKIDLK